MVKPIGTPIRLTISAIPRSTHVPSGRLFSVLISVGLRIRATTSGGTRSAVRLFTRSRRSGTWASFPSERNDSLALYAVIFPAAT